MASRSRIGALLMLSAGIGVLTSTANAEATFEQQFLIRSEGLGRSQALSLTAELADGIGPRLTGSENMEKAYDWGLETARRIGLDNPRLEKIEIETIPWRLDDVSVAMTAPDSMVFVAQAAPWSVGTRGTIRSPAIPVEISGAADFDKYRGKLRGKIILFGSPRNVPFPEEPLAVRYTDEEIVSGAPNEAVRTAYRNIDARYAKMADDGLFKTRLRAFLESEGVASVILPSRDGSRGGGSGNLSIDETPFTVRAWTASERPRFPIVFAAIEHYGRAWRLAEAGNSPVLRVMVKVTESKRPTPAYNVIGDIPGTDPALASQVVMAGAHLDSWAAGTGALDNASGVAMVLEAARILKTTGFKPRRTIRVVLFGAEEQGLHGSISYARKHLGRIPRSTTPAQLALTAETRRIRIGPNETLPGFRDFSIIYNMDAGSGRIRGVFAGGNPRLARRFEQWIKPLKDLGVLAVYDEPFYAADQSSFTDLGLPGVMFQQDPLEYFTRARHSNLDTMERISPGDLAQSATVLAIFLAHSASEPDLMPRS